MREPANVRDPGVHRVLVIQILVTAMVAAGFGIHSGTPSILASIYGGAITLAMTWWMARSVQRASTLAATDPARGSLALFGGLAQKYLFAMVALAVGFAIKLDALALLAGFGLTHLAFVFGGTGRDGQAGKVPRP